MRLPTFSRHILSRVQVLWLRTWFSWWLLPCWRTSISISSVISAKRSSHWKRQAGWKPLSCILSAYQQNGWEREGRTFWTYIQIKHTTLKYSLNKQYFFVAIISPIGFGWGILCLCKNQEPQKNPKSMDKYQNVTSIYKSRSQRIILRNWGNNHIRILKQILYINIKAYQYSSHFRKLTSFFIIWYLFGRMNDTWCCQDSR